MCPEDIGERLKSLLLMKDIKRSYLAKKIGISYNTLTNKLNGKGEFSAIEISKIKDILNLDVKLSSNIFFNPKYTIKRNRDD